MGPFQNGRGRGRGVPYHWIPEDMPAIAILSQEVGPKILGEGEATELATRAAAVAVDERGRFISFCFWPNNKIRVIFLRA